MGVLTGPQRKSTENSNETVVCFFGVIKSPSSGIHSGAGGIIQLGLVVVHFVRHLMFVNIFFPTDTACPLSVAGSDSNGHCVSFDFIFKIQLTPLFVCWF